MKDCGETATGPPPCGPLRRLLTALLYTVLAAALVFVLWQQWQS